MAGAPSIPLAGADLLITEFHLLRGLLKRGESIQEHVHSSLQLEIVLHGTIEFQSRAKPFPLHSGHCLVLPPHVPHEWRVTSGCIMLGVMLQPGLLDSSSFLPGLSLGNEPSLIKEWPSAQCLSALFDGMLEPWTRWNLLQTRLLMVQSLLGIIRACFPDQNLEIDTAQVNRSKRVIYRVCSFVHDNLGDNLSHKKMEEMAGMSARNLNRLFQKELGTSLHAYILSARLQKAREMLEKFPEMQVKCIAHDCGFSSPSHLGTSMKRMLKISPQVLRTK